MQTSTRQYQIWARPTLPPAAAETITLDKWNRLTPDATPKLRKALSVAILAGSCFFVSLGTSSAETPGLDKWMGELPDIIRRPKRVVPIEEAQPDFSVVSQVQILADWTPELPEYRPTPRRLVRADSSYPLLTSWVEAPGLDKWLGEYPDIINRLKKPLQFNQVQSDFSIVVPELVTLDKWIPSNPDRQREKHYPQHPDYKEPVLTSWLEMPGLDKWLGEYPDIINRVKRPLQFNELQPDYAMVVPEVITLDKWNPSVPVRFYIRPKLLQHGTYQNPLVIPPEVITLDKWFARMNEPRRLPVSMRHPVYIKLPAGALVERIILPTDFAVKISIDGNIVTKVSIDGYIMFKDAVVGYIVQKDSEEGNL